jgi:hypothetical protein
VQKNVAAPRTKTGTGDRSVSNRAAGGDARSVDGQAQMNDLLRTGLLVEKERVFVIAEGRAVLLVPNEFLLGAAGYPTAESILFAGCER